MTSVPAIGFEYSPSRWLTRVLAVMSVLSALAILLAAVPFWLKYPLAIAPLLACRYASLRFKRAPVRAAGWNRDGSWTLRFASGDDRPASLGSFRAMGDFIWLRLCIAESDSVVLLLAPDNTDADIRRRLRMRLALPAHDEVAKPA
jgi:toxin CptA